MARVFRLACYECKNSFSEEKFVEDDMVLSGCIKPRKSRFRKCFISRISCKDFSSKIHGSQGVLL